MKVSVIIATYNCEKYISRAVRSCIDQSMDKKDYEIIVVDDGSTDNTKRILQSFDDRIRPIYLEKNMKLPYACNTGIKHALANYVVRVDADDYVHADFLKVECLHMDMNRSDAVACDYSIVDDDENIVERMFAAKNPIACGVMFRKDCLVEIGLYDETFHLGEDQDLKVRFLKKFNIDYIALPLYRYRMHSSNSTSDKKKVQEYEHKLKIKHGFLPADQPAT